MFQNCISLLNYPHNKDVSFDKYIDNDINNILNTNNQLKNEAINSNMNKNFIKTDNNNDNEELKNLLIKYNNNANSSGKNKIKGVIKIELNELSDEDIDSLFDGMSVLDTFTVETEV